MIDIPGYEGIYGVTSCGRALKNGKSLGGYHFEEVV